MIISIQKGRVCELQNMCEQVCLYVMIVVSNSCEFVNYIFKLWPGSSFTCCEICGCSFGHVLQLFVNLKWHVWICCMCFTSDDALPKNCCECVRFVFEIIKCEVNVWICDGGVWIAWLNVWWCLWMCDNICECVMNVTKCVAAFCEYM